MKTPLIALAAAATAIAATPAIATETGDDMVVYYADLDLSSKAGQKTLDRRIDAAAKKFCRVNSDRSGTRISSVKADKCFRDVKRMASKQFAQMIDDSRLGG